MPDNLKPKVDVGAVRTPPVSYWETAYHRLQSLWLQSAGRAGCLDIQTIEDLATIRIEPKMLPQTLRLNSGHTIPVLGFGVYQSGAETYEAVLAALKAGYRHVDTAQFYRNEADVGRAIRDSKLPREEVFVTSKLWLTNWGADRAKKATEETLRKLDLGYVDLMLLHAPGDSATRAETWRALEAFVASGSVRSLGVSNFGPAHIDKLLQTASVPPSVNQIELHPWLQWAEVVRYCQGKGIAVEAYSPLAKAQKMDDPTLRRIATRHSVEPAQVLVRWGLQKGFVVLPKSVHEARIRKNAEVWNFELSDADMKALDGLECDFVTGWDPIRDDKV